MEKFTGVGPSGIECENRGIPVNQWDKIVEETNDFINEKILKLQELCVWSPEDEDEEGVSREDFMDSIRDIFLESIS